MPLWNTLIPYATGDVITGSDGNAYRAVVASSGIDPATDDGTAWVAWEVTVNTTLAVSSTGRFLDIAAALAFIANAIIRPKALVTITVADGTYTHAVQITIDHPQGRQIAIVGNLTAPANVVLNFNNDTCGFVIAARCALGRLNGIKIVGTNATTPGAAVSLSAIIAMSGAYVYLGQNATDPANVIIQNFYYGLSAVCDGQVIANGYGPQHVSISGAGDVGIWAYDSGFITCQYAQVTGSADQTNGWGWGIQAERGGNIHADYVIVSGCLKGGIYSNGGSIRCKGSTANGNTGHGYQADFGGRMDMTGTCSGSNNGGDGCHVERAGSITAGDSGNKTFNGNTGSGIYALAGTVVMPGASCGALGAGNGQHGISVDQGGTVNIVGGSSQYNTLDGIRCFSGSRCIATGAVVKYNGAYGVDVWGVSFANVAGAANNVGGNTLGDIIAQYDSFVWGNALTGVVACTPVKNTFPTTGNTSGSYIKI